jgi:hypothetical protein
VAAQGSGGLECVVVPRSHLGERGGGKG